MKKTIDDCFFQIQNGANIKQGDVDGGFPITRIETTANDKFNRDRMGYAGITDISKYESYVLEDGDLLMSHINSVQYLGRTVLYVKQTDETIIHGMNLLRLKARRDVINPAYARYCFYGNQFRHQVRKITKKSVNQASFAVKDLKQIKIDVPSLSEQEQIVEILDKLQKIIEMRSNELSTLDELIKARFVEMFGDPVYNTNDLPIRNLNELGNWASGGTPSRTVSEYFEGNIDWYSAGELNTLFLEGSVEKITEEAIEKSATKLFKAGSLLIGMYDTAAFKMGILKEDSASNQACACITPNDEVNIIWLYYELQMMKEYFLSQRRGVRQKNLNLGMIKAFKIPIAERDQQDEFSDFVNQVNKSKVAIQAALDKSQLLFDSLMQKYFG